MFKKRIALIVLMCIFSLACLGMINRKYDVLARYQYTKYLDQSQQDLICEKLDSSEIEYIIEYAISPFDFLPFIECEDFNIYDIAYYNIILKNFPYTDPEDCITLGNNIKNGDMEADYLLAYLYSYDSSVLVDYLNNYDYDLNLLFDPASYSLKIYDNGTVCSYVPEDLVRVLSLQTENNSPVYLRSEAKDALTEMCALASDQLKGNSCGGMIVENGYIAYNRQNDEIDIPGTSEHQLGLCVDLMLLDEEAEFTESEQYQWLLENAGVFGFIMDDEAHPNHLRYYRED